MARTEADLASNLVHKIAMILEPQVFICNTSSAIIKS